MQRQTTRVSEDCAEYLRRNCDPKCAQNCAAAALLRTSRFSQSNRSSTWYHLCATYGVAPCVTPCVPSSPIFPSLVNWNCATRLFTSFDSPRMKWPASARPWSVRT